MSERVVKRTAIVLGCYFLGVLGGLILPQGRGMGEQLRELRLQAFGRFPLRQLGRAMLVGNAPRTAAIMAAVNLNASVLHFAAGLIYLSPLLAATQGFLVGSMLAVRRSAGVLLFSALVLPLEAGAFALSGALGMERASRWLAARRGESERGEDPGSLLWGIPAVVLLQALGGVAEAAGAVRFKFPGVLTREEIARAVES
jgi:hypothetical protein